MARTVFRVLLALVAVVALSDCYGAKMVKGPINTEKAALASDTLLVQQRRILDRIDAIEQRLNRESEERTAFQARASVTLSELEDAVRMLTGRIDDNSQQDSRSGRDNSRSSGGSSDSTAAAAEELYRAAYMDVSRGNYDLASQALQEYLTRFPNGVRVAEAHYYLGECNFANERYLEAAGEFQRLVREFPNARQAPAAYLKMGRSYARLEERELATKAFQALIQKHPNTEEAKQAQAALQELGG